MFCCHVVLQGILHTNVHLKTCLNDGLALHTLTDLLRHLRVWMTAADAQHQGALQQIPSQRLARALRTVHA